MFVRGVRGATTASLNNSEMILDATTDLLRLMVEKNSINKSDIASVFFSTTPDIDAVYPALAARDRLGWNDVPLFGSQEAMPPDAIKLCIRILILWNTPKPQSQIEFIYLRGAANLRDQ